LPKLTRDEESELIDSFLNKETAVLALFGYDGGLCPLIDYRNLYWTIESKTDRAVLIYSNEGPLSKEMIADGEVKRLDVDVSSVVAQSAYAKTNFTLVCLNDEGDSPRRLGIFDNEKRSEFDRLYGNEIGVRQ